MRSPDADTNRNPVPVWRLVRSSPALAALAAFHGLLLVAMLVWPGLWLTALLALVGVQFLVVVAVLQPRNPLFGPNLTRLPAAAIARGEVALTFDDGPDPVVTPQVLAILDQFGAKASFFVVGTRVEANPDLARQIAARGHSVENHTGHHALLFSLFHVAGIRREVMQLQTRVQEICGVAPRFFRPPAGFHSPLVCPLLAVLGLRLATWTRRGFDTRDASAARVLARLQRNLGAGDILLLHDGNAARSGDGTPVVLRVLPELLRALQDRGLKAVTLPQAVLPHAGAPGQAGN